MTNCLNLITFRAVFAEWLNPGTGMNRYARL